MLVKSVLVNTYKYVMLIAFLLIGIFNNTFAVAILNPGIVESSQTICSGATPNPFTSISLASGGIGPYNYKWQKSTTGLFTGYTDIVGANAITYASGALTQTTYFRRAVSTLDDPLAFSDPITITVNAASVGGTISGGGHYCPTIAFPVLFLSGHVGSIVRWERSTVPDFSSNVTTINFTSTNLTTTIITPSTTYYRAVVKNGVCPEVFSDIDTVVIDFATVGGTITGGAGVCAGTNSTLLTLSGYTGSIVKWQSSTSPTFSNSITDIVNTSNTYTALNILVPTYFRAVLKSGTCSNVNSSIASILILSPTVGGSLTGPLGFCGNVNSSTLTLSTHVGTIIEWQSSTTSDFSSAVTSIPSTANLISYTVVNLSTTTYFRVLLQNGPCATAFSSIKALSALTPFPVAGTISGPSSLCTGPNNGTLILTGFSGSVLKWQSCTNANFSSGVTDIANTTNTLNIVNLAAALYYRAIVFNGPIACEDTTAPKQITLDTNPIAGNIIGNDSICATTSLNATLLTLTGFTGSITKWQSSTSPTFTSGVFDITNTTNTYTATNITTTTYYRAIVASGSCLPDTSNIGVVFIHPASIGGSVFGNNPFNPNVIVCTGTNSSTLILIGHTGTIVRWQSCLNSNFTGVITNIVNTSSTYIATNLTATTYYRAIVKSGECDSAISAVRVITVNPISDGGVLGSDTVCIGINSNTLRLTNYVGSIVKWESSAVSNFSSGITTISNTTDSLIVVNLSTTTYYRVVVKSGVCSSDTSNIAHILVNAAPVGGTLSGGGHFCPTVAFPVLFLTGQVGTILRWEQSTVSDFSSNVTVINFTGTNYSTTIITPSVFYYRAVIGNGVCPFVYSSIDTIIIDSTSVGGAISGSTNVCLGTNSTTLTLSSYIGSIVKWQSSTSATFSNNVLDIPNTTATYTATNLTTTTYYRVIVKNGECDTAISAVRVISVNPISDGGVLKSDTVCAGVNLTTLHLTSYVGSIVKWESSSIADFSSGVTNIANTTDSLVVTNLSTTTYYRVIVKSGVCSADTSNIVHILVNSPSSAGTITGATTVCAGINNVQLQLSTSTGNIIKWQRSTSNNFTNNVVDINTSNTSINIINLTTTTYVRVLVKNGVCDADTSIVIAINVDVPSDAGLLVKSDTVCAGVNSSTLHLTNYVGSIVKWESSSIADFSSGVTSIANTTDSLVVINLSSTTCYRAIVKSGVCSADTSNIVHIHVFSSIYTNVIFQSQPDSFLVSGDPNIITGSTANADSVFYTYQWQLSTINDSTGFTSIFGANTRDYNPDIINQTTWYRRILVNTYCSVTDTSNVVVFVIISDPINSNPRIGSSKSVLKPKVISFGSYQIQYTITVENFGNTDLHNIRVLENLTSTFPSPAVFSILNITSGSSLGVNANFDGVNNLELLDPSQSSLNIGESSTITIKIVLNPNLPNVVYNNQVLVLADVVNGSSTVVDTSVNGDNPDPNGDDFPDEDSPTPVNIAVFVPSGYSPNGDGKNDEFIIVGLENYPNNKLEIYNRWGNKVFEQSPYDNTWKGAVKNIEGYVIGEGLLPSGTYFYLLDFGVPGVEQLTGYIVIRK